MECISEGCQQVTDPNLPIQYNLDWKSVGNYQRIFSAGPRRANIKLIRLPELTGDGGGRTLERGNTPLLPGQNAEQVKLERWLTGVLPLLIRRRLKL